MKRIIVTPAGRKRYVEVLLRYLLYYKEEFDCWHLWLNTENSSDIDYLNQISLQYDFIKIVPPKVSFSGNSSIPPFYIEYINKNEIYLRLDDDIVYIKKGSIKKMFDIREENTEHFLIFGNILNNGIVTHLYQNKNLISDTIGNCEYSSFDKTSYQNPQFCEHIHRIFFSKFKQNKIDDFILPNHEIIDTKRFSINVFSWRGDDFSKFDGKLESSDDEQYLSCDLPKKLNKKNIIIGDTLFCHFAYVTQRDYIDKTDILDLYNKISLNQPLPECYNN